MLYMANAEVLAAAYRAHPERVFQGQLLDRIASGACHYNGCRYAGRHPVRVMYTVLLRGRERAVTFDAKECGIVHGRQRG